MKGSTRMNVHFWLGAETSKDEAAAAALMTVELDQFLAGDEGRSRHTSPI